MMREEMLSAAMPISWYMAIPPTATPGMAVWFVPCRRLRPMLMGRIALLNRSWSVGWRKESLTAAEMPLTRRRRHPFRHSRRKRSHMVRRMVRRIQSSLSQLFSRAMSIHRRVGVSQNFSAAERRSLFISMKRNVKATGF